MDESFGKQFNCICAIEIEKSNANFLSRHGPRTTVSSIRKSCVSIDKYITTEC